jgi:hypothetical protein
MKRVAVILSLLLTQLALAGEPAGAPDDTTCQALRQAPQGFMKRSHYRYDCGADCAARHARVIAYRTRHYGRFGSFGEPSQNARAPKAYTEETRFMGLPVRVNRHLVPLLACAERELREECAACRDDARYPGECAAKTFPYAPTRLSGLRSRNTFRGGEVSNHVYGIGLDVDPTKNTCCKCVKKWRNHPLCKRDLPVHLRMAMPMCWVEIFARYGFHWLGHGRLEDTMHVEFLGDPEQVARVMGWTKGGQEVGTTPP